MDSAESELAVVETIRIALDGLGRTSGLLLAHGGRLVVPHTGEALQPATACPSFASGEPVCWPATAQCRRICPLGGLAGGRISCWPITWAGDPAGVLQVAYPPLLPGPEGGRGFVQGLTRLAAVALEAVGERDLLREHATLDALTGLANRRALEAFVARMERRGVPFGVLLFDLDHFKFVNDAHGHDAGDEVLRHFAKVLDQGVRPGDLAARWGGEEFLAVIQQAGVEESLVVAERIRRAMEGSDVNLGGSQLRVTVSVGVSASGSCGRFEAVREAADAALYLAKEGGRNRCKANPVPAN